MYEQWMLLMEDETMRWVIEGGIGAVWMVVVYLAGVLAKKWGMPKEVLRFFAVIGAAAGLVVAFFATLVIPGLQIKELFALMTGGALGSQGIHATRKAYLKRKNGGAK